LKDRPYILSIAGFDPSGGAGSLADIKTFEQHKLQGLSVVTANTIQTEDEFISVNWVEVDVVLQQLHILLDRYKIRYAKIGLIKDASTLKKLLGILNDRKITCLWDPILSSTTGAAFHAQADEFQELLPMIDYVTPNWTEIKELSGENGVEGGKLLSKVTKIYLKGGHSDQLAKDFLIQNERVVSFKPKNMGLPKHGSGCIFSSALLSNLALGFPEIKACLRAKRYTEMRLLSNPSLLAYHET
jgi:hydroxymethylpyrimidine/phosphomethylpyrimidine kinase